MSIPATSWATTSAAAPRLSIWSGRSTKFVKAVIVPFGARTTNGRTPTVKTPRRSGGHALPPMPASPSRDVEGENGQQHRRIDLGQDRQPDDDEGDAAYRSLQQCCRRRSPRARPATDRIATDDRSDEQGRAARSLPRAGELAAPRRMRQTSRREGHPIPRTRASAPGTRRDTRWRSPPSTREHRRDREGIRESGGYSSAKSDRKRPE